jgi:hypothetical protein
MVGADSQDFVGARLSIQTGDCGCPSSYRDSLVDTAFIGHLVRIHARRLD